MNLRIYSSCHVWNKVLLIHCLIIIFKFWLVIWWVIPTVFRHTHTKVHYQKQCTRAFIHWIKSTWGITMYLQNRIVQYLHTAPFFGDQDLLAIYFSAGSNLPPNWLARKIPCKWCFFFGKSLENQPYMEVFVAGNAVPGLYLWPLLLLCEHHRLLGLACWLQPLRGMKLVKLNVPSRWFYEAHLFQESSKHHSHMGVS